MAEVVPEEFRIVLIEESRFDPSLSPPASASVSANDRFRDGESRASGDISWLESAESSDLMDIEVKGGSLLSSLSDSFLSRPWPVGVLWY
jgi:hypothetical protein